MGQKRAPKKKNTVLASSVQKKVTGLSRTKLTKMHFLGLFLKFQIELGGQKWVNWGPNWGSDWKNWVIFWSKKRIDVGLIIGG